MSAWIPCRCEGSHKEKMKNWRVLHRNCNYSYFEYPKGGRHYSDYSQVVCLNCFGNFRTKSDYVDDLLNITPEELNKKYPHAQGGK